MTSPISRIICGIDLDEPAGAPAAICWSRQLAGLTGAELHLIGVTTPASAERSPELLADIHRGALTELEVVAPVPDPLTHLHTATGTVVDVITARAQALQPDLVVSASRHVEGATPLGLQGIGHTLAHRLDIPIATVANLAGPLDHGTYVVGVDGSPLSHQALIWTQHLARATRGRCCAVYSIDDIYDSFDSSGWFGPDEQMVRGTVASDASTELVERTGGNPADTLQAIAAERNAAAIVVAARQRHSFGGMLLGIVPDHLLHQPHGPVIVLPHAVLNRTATLVEGAHHR